MTTDQSRLEPADEEERRYVLQPHVNLRELLQNLLQLLLALLLGRQQGRQIGLELRLLLFHLHLLDLPLLAEG